MNQEEISDKFETKGFDENGSYTICDHVGKAYPYCCYCADDIAWKARKDRNARLSFISKLLGLGECECYNPKPGVFTGECTKCDKIVKDSYARSKHFGSLRRSGYSGPILFEDK